MKFSHLHVHTQYSLLDGAAPIGSLYKKAIADGMPALAISDHGNMYGAFQFVAEAYKHLDENGKPKVKPVVGCEFYLVENRHEKTFTKEKKDKRYHQILLAKNEQGYRNLTKLTSLGFIEGLYGKYPRIDKELILQYHEGLIATTCCLGASVPQAILRKGEAEAEAEFKWWLDLFGEDFYVELQRHGIGDQDKVNEVLIHFAYKYKVPIIASNDSHYVEQDDFNAHDILLCINTGEKQSTPAFRGDFADDDVNMKNMRFAFANDQFYFKNTEEMSKLFHDLPEAIDNTNAIVDKIELLDLKRSILLPNFPIPEDFKRHTEDEKTDKGVVTADSLNQWEYLRHLTYEGARQRYGIISDSTQERIDFELFTIKTMGFAGYFLIVSDFIKAGRDSGVFIGPGRGSAAGSVVAYCIGITNIDPIKYNLLFERFLNPDRKSMPDIDTDFDDEGRQRVIDYVVQKYGKNQVAQIITYGTMAAKMSIKDVARVMDLPLADSNALAKLVPEKPGISLKRVLHAPLSPKAGEKTLIEKEGLGADDIENVKRIRDVYNGNDLQAKVLHEAEILEGSVRNTGIHAAGIIIAPKDLTELIPVSTAKDSDLWVTQIEGSVIEEAGVIKMDFLGLKTLTIIKDALKLIKQNYDLDIVIDDIPLDDEKTYELYQKGETNATFQFESAGMQKYLRELKPDRFDDLIAMNALYRPGPLAYIPDYIERKHGRQEVVFDLPEMEEDLKDTYGITVYQEQVMLLSQKLAGFSKGDADVLRKAMGKKQKAVLDKMKKQFVEGATQKGHPADKLDKIWTDWEAFAQYAFNKSHATCYAFVAYQTAYLKAHYPSEYMAGVLNNAGSLEKITFFMEECKRMGLPVLGPDINESQKGFAVNKKGEIRFGLGGLKGVGEAAVESLIQERDENGPYASIFDMIKRVNQRTVNKKTLESLAYAGAFDCFTDLHRAQYFHVPVGDTTNGLEKIVKYGQICQTQAQTTTNTLFGDLAEVMEVQIPKIPECTPWPLVVQLDHEKQVTGIFISGHPLDDYRFEMEHYGITKISYVNDYKNQEKEKVSSAATFKIMGLVSDAQHRVSRTGNKFGSFIIEDYSGKLDMVLFSEDYMKYSPMLQLGTTVYLTGFFKQRFNGDFDFKITSICLAESVIKNQTKNLKIELPVEEITKETVEFIHENLKAHKGPSTLKLSIKDAVDDVTVDLLTRGKGFEMNNELIEYLSKQANWNIAVELN
ncbi:DNA polymerase III subunit alpha [Niabella sp. CC-SYL272]|uniref:DNA polymerase III subunit alpha n=1 Tax=Niabella agricola TaxID=2891571 RepID=UPI001F209246|nr:DNA polymerase III subunit alpha [Niabella agricola]MCF3108892.1 DNA polymerase III subunit alpha [Niabella agricola]